MIGNLARDVVGDSLPRVGGAPFHGARALRLVGSDAVVFAQSTQEVADVVANLRRQNKIGLECSADFTAQVVIGLWIAGANLLAGRWLGWQRWLGVVTGLGWALVGAGLIAGGMSHPLSWAGGIGYLLLFPVWAFLMGRLLSAMARDAGIPQPAPAR